jgi:hypothetical protein
MDETRRWRERTTPAALAVSLVVVVAVLTGPLGLVDLTGEPAQLGDGNASVAVLGPETGRIPMTEGRFGADVMYTRLPDLAVEITAVTGRPRILYTVRVPELRIDRTVRRLVRSEGRMRIRMSDYALPRENDDFPDPLQNRSYDGTLVVRVQSFTTQYTVLNRSVEVRVE